MVGTELARPSSRWFRTGVETSDEAIVFADLEGVILSCNKAATRLYGFEDQELRGRHWAVLEPWWRQGEVTSLLDRVGRGEHVERFRTQRLSRSGDILTVLLAVAPVVDSHGRVVGVTAMARESADGPVDHHCHGDELRRAQRWFRAVVSHTAELILVSDSAFRILYTNPAARQMFGDAVTRDTRTLGELVHPDDWDQVTAVQRQLLGAAWGEASFGARLVGADGAVRTFQVVVTNRLDDPAVGGLVYNARDVSELEGVMTQLSDLFDSVTMAIARTVEQRDPYTAGHQRHVAQLAEAMAAELGLSESERRGVWVAASIHDIGKISVPADVLTRPGRLSTHEFDLIRRHPQIGADIADSIPFPWPVAEMVLQHHERLNGSGYPVGLTGDAIGVGARIIAVADVVEAIASHRPYRPSLGLDAALTEVARRDGRFDPAVAATCLRVFSSGFAFA